MLPFSRVRPGIRRSRIGIRCRAHRRVLVILIVFGGHPVPIVVTVLVNLPVTIVVHPRADPRVGVVSVRVNRGVRIVAI